MSLVIQISGNAVEELAKRNGFLARAMILALRQSVEAVRAMATENVSGKVLNVRTGTLRERITAMVEESSLRGIVGNSVKYAAVHEFGGTFQIPAHPRRTKTGSTIVRAHDATYPERAWLRPALADNHETIKGLFQRAVQRALQGSEG